MEMVMGGHLYNARGTSNRAIVIRLALLAALAVIVSIGSSFA